MFWETSEKENVMESLGTVSKYKSGCLTEKETVSKGLRRKVSEPWIYPWESRGKNQCKE